MNNLVTFCSELVCYSGEYTAHHPMVPPGVVYGLANGVADKLPLVLYDLQKSPQSSSFSLLYWVLHYSSVTGVMLIGASIFKHLFLSEINIQYSTNEVEGIRKEYDYSKKYYDKYDTLCEKYSTTTSNVPDNNKRIKMQKNQVIDYTGKHGNVLMKYNEESEAFEYYADNKNIPFTFLESVSRKLAISFHCTNVIEDRRSLHYLKDNQKNKQTDNEKDQNKEKEKLPISKSNKFIYIGKFSSINPLQTSLYEESSSSLSKKYIRSKYSYKEYMSSLNKV